MLALEIYNNYMNKLCMTYPENTMGLINCVYFFKYKQKDETEKVETKWLQLFFIL